MSLKEVKLGDISTMKYGKMPKKEDMTDNGYPVFSGYRITGFSKKFLYKEPQVVVVARGVGGTGDVKLSPHFAYITNLSIILECYESIDKKYLVYKLSTENLKRSLDSGAAQSQITITALSSYKIKIPPLETQQKIASILSAYDDLIENNLRRIKLLEEAARLIYKEWFVRLRFPGHENTRIADGLPEGWGYEDFGKICKITMGQSPESAFYNEHEEGLPFHQGVTDFGDRFITHSKYCTKPSRIGEKYDILCSVRAPVGRLNITLDKIIIGRGLSAIRNNKGFQTFQFYQLKSYFYKEDMIGGGAIFASVTRKQLESQKMLIPTDKLISAFEKIVKPMDKQIENLFCQNQKLREARDILLPRLMNGSIQV